MSHFRWVVGLAPLAALLAAAIATEAPRIEADLAERARAVMAQIESERSLVEVAGRDVAVSATVFEPVEERLRAAVSGLTGVRRVVASANPPPLANPYMFVAERAGAGLALSGFAPNPAARARILEAAGAGLSGREIKDALAYASGAPDRFAALAAEGARLASALEGGRFVWSGGVAALSGLAPDAQIFEQASAPPRNLPAGVRFEASGVVAPRADPFELVIARTATGLRVSGHAPRAADRDAILAALRTAAAPGALEGSLAIASGLPEGVDYQAAVRFLGVQAARLRAGAVALRGDEVTMSGETTDSAALAALMSALRPSLPGGVRLTRVDVKPAVPHARPFVFSAERGPSGVVLRGATPSLEARGELLRALRAAAPGVEISDVTSLATGAPEGFLGMAAHGLQQLARLSSGRFTLRDRDYALEGDAPDPAIFESVLDAAPPPPAIAARPALRPPLAEPFLFSARVEQGALVLSGHAPDRETRARLIEAAGKLFPGLTIRNDLAIARGAGAFFEAAADAALAALVDLEGGEARLVGATLRLSGKAPAGASADALAAALSGRLPAGVSLDLASLVIPPLVDPLALLAPLPPEAELNLSDVAVRAEPKVDPPAPAPVMAANPAKPAAPPMVDALVLLAPLPPEAELNLSDVAVRAEPRVDSPAPAPQVAPAPAPAAQPETASQAVACERDAGGAIRAGALYFDRGSALTDARGAQTLARIAEIARVCGARMIVAEGHTDSTGLPRYNMRLSFQRAFEALAGLQGAGAPSVRLVARGFGATRPAMPETTDEARAGNRRVEIILR